MDFRRHRGIGDAILRFPSGTFAGTHVLPQCDRYQAFIAANPGRAVITPSPAPFGKEPRDSPEAEKRAKKARASARNKVKPKWVTDFDAARFEEPTQRQARPSQTGQHGFVAEQTPRYKNEQDR